MGSVVDNVRFYGAVMPLIHEQLEQERQIALRELELEDVPVRFNEHGQLQVTAAELEHIQTVFSKPAAAKSMSRFMAMTTGIPIVVVNASTLGRPDH